MGDPVPSSAISDATTGGLSVIVITGGSTGQVLTLQANGTYAPATVSAGIGGNVGSTTNRLVKSSGTDGSTVQATGITVDASNNVSGAAVIEVSSYIGSPVYVTSDSSIRLSSSGCNVGSGQTFGISSATNPNNAARDVQLSRNATGPKWCIAADGGAEIRNLAKSADAPLTASSITLSGATNLAPITKAALLLLTPNGATGGRWRVTDATPAHRAAYPDGTNWRYTSDDVVVT